MQWEILIPLVRDSSNSGIFNYYTCARYGQVSVSNFASDQDDLGGKGQGNAKEEETADKNTPPPYYFMIFCHSFVLVKVIQLF
ncbi:hypothetical protein [Gelidibacter japonicus]|uniref:hypothetical protein n=1 Tax=Gelidibacter japonicus TaxID=1962232 RepID=UPI0013D160C6|nr:hypothetical protein [Gelidibacter japonicus]